MTDTKSFIDITSDSKWYYYSLWAVVLAGELVLVALSVFVLKTVRRCASLHVNLRVSTTAIFLFRILSF